MILTSSDEHLLYIEPKSAVAEAPVDDELTVAMEALLSRSRQNGKRYRGYHTCACGVKSSNTDYLIGTGPVQTNSLCVHYLRMHRSEVPSGEIDKLLALMSAYGMEAP